MSIALSLLNKSFPLFANTGEHADKNLIFVRGERTKSDFAFFDKECKLAFNAKKIEVGDRPYFLVLNIFNTETKESVNGSLFQNQNPKEGSPGFTGYLGKKDAVEARLEGNRRKDRNGKWYLHISVLPPTSKKEEGVELNISDCPF